MKRKLFLTEFLGALGAEKIEWKVENNDFISGTAIYEINDPEETQDFCWHMSEENTPSSSLLKLARLLNEKKLLSIDKITVNREELKSFYNEKYETNITTNEFNQILEALELIEVPMVDEGGETDIFFIHE